MFTKKLIISLSVIATLLTIIGGVFAVEQHYATNKTVEQLEINIAGALENQQLKGDVRYFQFMYDKIMNDIYTLKRQMEKHPNDELLKEDYRELLERRKEIKIKLEQALRNIKVG